MTAAIAAFMVMPVVYLSTRFRLITGFLAMAALVGGLSLAVGARLLTASVFGEASNRVRQDLDTAREMYRSAEDRLELGLTLVALQPEFLAAAGSRDLRRLSTCIDTLAGQLGLDFAGLVSPEGRTLYRTGPGSGDPRALNPAAALALQRRAAVSGTLVLSAEELAAEDPRLAARARIPLVPTARAAPRDLSEETEGLALACALPLPGGPRGADRPGGALYGGVLLNRNNQLVDRVRDTVFRQEIYRGRQVGTATLFLRDLRIATNVLDSDGRRAIGTRASAQVKERVLDQGQRWLDRAFVVRDWYITAYEPIADLQERTVGMLYVGVLEAKYADLRRSTVLVFALITAGGLALAVLLGSLLSARLLDPVQRLIQASHRVSQGDLSPEIGPRSRGELGVLQRTFQEMLGSLRDRDRHQRAESELRLLHSEKQASIGRLAAGVAHEINNPLTGVLTFTHLLLKRPDLDAGAREDLATIAAATERVRKIVKGLLDFSRQSRLEPQSTDLNELISATIPLVANQALVKGVRCRFSPGPDIPARTLDRNQFQSVLLNILLNALDATPAGGHIDVGTRLDFHDGRGGIQIAVADTGHGIPAEHLERIFDPFYTTKEVGQGTGLGLSVSQGIVARHGGSIRVRSQVGQGSTFTIWLPLEGGAA